MIYISHLLPDQEMAELIDAYHTGVESIEFSISENLDQRRKKIKEYKERLEAWGNPPLSLHGPFLDLNPAAFDSKIRAVTMTRFRQAYEIAAELQAEKIIYHSGFIPGIYYLEGWAERAAEFWNDFLPGKTEIPVLMENVLDPKPEEFAKVAELVEQENFHFCFDIGHANCYSRSGVFDWIHWLSGKITHVHIHDNNGERDAHMALGDGDIPYPAVVETIKAWAQDVTCTIECNTKRDVEITLEKIKGEFMD